MISVRPHLWFADNNAADAASFYAEHIPGSSVQKVIVAPDGVPGATAGAPFIIEFTLAGVPVIGLNAGPTLRLSEAFSFYLSVDTQAEVDHFWNLLTDDGGEPGPCGWCKDRFGVSWQVIPRRLEELSGDYTTDAHRRVIDAMLQMGKIDIAALEAANDTAG